MRVEGDEARDFPSLGKGRSECPMVAVTTAWALEVGRLQKGQAV